MIWLWVVVLVVVIGAVAVLAAGRETPMSEAYEDRPDRTIPTGRALTADDLQTVRFTTALRGYRMDEVDALIDRLTADLIAREHRTSGAPLGVGPTGRQHDDDEQEVSEAENLGVRADHPAEHRADLRAEGQHAGREPFEDEPAQHGGIEIDAVDQRPADETGGPATGQHQVRDQQ